ncbi:transcriptional regulator with XRE-family HTH domain [Mycobacteroides chelonae]|nr:transcriptional regulator with XRE-family HTH domain [Mycobacteroides chelonae]
MTPTQTANLAQLLREKRAETGLGIPGIATRAHVDRGTLWRLERGMVSHPRAEILLALASALNIPPTDLFITIGWLPADQLQLPTLRTYLRTAYPQLPNQVIQKMKELLDEGLRPEDPSITDNYQAPTAPTAEDLEWL